MAEQGVLRAAADNVDVLVVSAGAFFYHRERAAVFHRKALVDAAHDLTDRLRDILTRSAAEFAHAAGDISGRGELGGVGVDKALERLGGERHALELRVAVVLALALPLSAALLNEPETDYILEQPRHAAVAALVGDVYRERGLVHYGSGYLRAEERPSAAAQKREAVKLRRNGGYRRLRVVSADADDLHGVESQFVADLLAQHAVFRARRNNGREYSRGYAEAVKNIVSPIFCLYIDHLRGRGNGIFGLLFAREHISEKVGHEQQLIRPAENVRTVFFERAELEERVELHELNARAGIEFLAWHGLENLVYHALRARVAVMHGIFEQAAELIQKPEVNAPGVYAYAVEAAGELRLCQPLLYLEEQAQNIPVERAVHAHGVVREAVNLLKADVLPVKMSDYRAPARRAEVERQNSLCHF